MDYRWRWWAIALAAGSAIAATLAAWEARAQVTSAADGVGTIVTVNGNQFQIHGGTLAGANLLHSFQQFGLDSGQIADFLAQPQLANILARVTGGQASTIDGLIQIAGGNPNLYLMNPAGIVFGTKARLNVPGDFFATTATAIGFESGGWFEATGTLHAAQLTGTPTQFAFDLSQPAPLVNAGQLQLAPGQNLTLLAGQAINTGHLQAPGGSITVSAVPGSRLVKLSQPGHLLSLEIEPPRAVSGVLQNIDVVDLPTLLTGSGLETGLTVTPDAAIQFTASGQTLQPLPELTAASGRLDAGAPNGAGGAIAVLGDRVVLFGADLEASGGTGGGQILVGGDYKGGGTVPNARRTLVDAASSIRADALDSGDGGRVILWADEVTGFWGEISARGGAQSGDGGFVEVSGKQQLVFAGDVDVTAAAGQAGSLLLDPFNIQIVAAPSPDDIEVIDGEILLNAAPGDTLFISADALESFVGAELILEAANDIIISPGVDLFFDGDDVGSVVFVADADAQGQGAFFMGSEGLIDTGGADLEIYGAEIQVGEIITESLSFDDSGSVLLEATTRSTNSNIEFAYIDTSSTTGFGGDIEIIANGTVQGIETNGFGNTLDAFGVSGGGSILIEYNGGPLGLLFTVGDAFENGVIGGIETNGTRISPNPVQSFESATIGDIAIRFTGTETLDEFDDDFFFDEDFEAADEDFEAAEFDNFFSFEESAELDSSYEDFDTEATEEFTDYFEDIPQPESVSQAGAEQALGEITTQTGEVPVVFYARYAPAIARTPAAPLAPPNVSAENAGAFVAAGSRELWRFDGAGAGWERPIAGQTGTAATQRNPNDALELAVVFGAGSPVRRLVTGVTRADVDRVAAQLRRAIVSPRRPNAFRRPARQLHEWLIAPVEAELQARGVTNIAFVLASGLRSLPLAALTDGEQFLIERYSLGLMPSLSLTDTRYQTLQNTSVLAMGASEFRDQSPLPAVPLELDIIADRLWSGETLLNQEFTPSNLTAARAQGAYGIVHLGTHGEFKPGRADESFIWFGNSRLPLSDLRELSLDAPPTELLVLSACRTALGDRQAELGFAGLAVQSGVKSALGSLWYVSDVGTLAFMTSFYDQLQRAPIKAEALRQAQLALISGETYFEAEQLVSPAGAFDLPPELAQAGDSIDLSHPFYWSAFTMIGSPW